MGKRLDMNQVQGNTVEVIFEHSAQCPNVLLLFRWLEANAVGEYAARMLWRSNVTPVDLVGLDPDEFWKLFSNPEIRAYRIKFERMTDYFKFKNEWRADE